MFSGRLFFNFSFDVLLSPTTPGNLVGPPPYFIESVLSSWEEEKISSRIKLLPFLEVRLRKRKKGRISLKVVQQDGRAKLTGKKKPSSSLPLCPMQLLRKRQRG